MKSSESSIDFWEGEIEIYRNTGKLEKYSNDNILCQNNNIIRKGSILRKTKFTVGLVIYVG